MNMNMTQIYIIYTKQYGRQELALTEDQWNTLLIDLSTSSTWHREDGPAVEYPDGSKYWFIKGKLHREDGPAVEYPDGSKNWYVNGKLHREDGPAVEYPDGSKNWYVNGRCHREDGPAIEYSDGVKVWVINDKKVSILTKKQLIRYMELNNYVLAHLFTDPNIEVIKATNKYKDDILMGY